MTSFTPNIAELHTLTKIYEKNSSHYYTRAGIIRLCKDDASGLDKRVIIEALDVLISKKFLDKKQFSSLSKNSPYGFNRASSIKTDKFKLSGKALLYLSGRSAGTKEKSPHVAQTTDPSSLYSIQRDFEKIFEGATRRILIVDNYIGRKTLDYLITANVPIKIITTSHEERGFETAKQAFMTQYPSTLEIRVKDGAFHGRFLIVDDKYYVVDHSIKDYGKKPSMIVEIVDNGIQASMLKLFNDNWS